MSNKFLNLKETIQAGLDLNRDGLLSSSEQVEAFSKVVGEMAKMIGSKEFGKVADPKLLLKTPKQIQKLFPDMVKDFGLSLRVEQITLDQAKVMAPIYNDAVKAALAQRS